MSCVWQNVILGLDRTDDYASVHTLVEYFFTRTLTHYSWACLAADDRETPCNTLLDLGSKFALLSVHVRLNQNCDYLPISASLGFGVNADMIL